MQRRAINLPLCSAWQWHCFSVCAWHSPPFRSSRVAGVGMCEPARMALAAAAAASPGEVRAATGLRYCSLRLYRRVCVLPRHLWVQICSAKFTLGRLWLCPRCPGCTRRDRPHSRASSLRLLLVMHGIQCAASPTTPAVCGPRTTACERLLRCRVGVGPPQRATEGRQNHRKKEEQEKEELALTPESLLLEDKLWPPRR